VKNREVAWRVFAGEFSSSRVEIKGEGEKMPSYVVSPLGAMMNRVFVVGVLTDIENIGSNEPFWRARISDPTGTFYLSSGQYQPEATMALSKIQPPKFVAVVGKIRTYSPEEGTMYVSIRPEKITVVDIALRDYWVMETCKATLRRISAMEEAKKMSTPSVDELVKLGYGQALAEGVVKSIEMYGEVDLTNYRHMVVDALKFLMPEQQAGIDIPDLDSEAPEEIDDEVVTDPEAQQTQEDKEKVVLALVEQLDKGGKGAPWDDIVAEAKKSGIEREELDEISNSLLDKGLVYEPVLGKMKVI
jgi:RPA family protein